MLKEFLLAAFFSVFYEQGFAQGALAFNFKTPNNETIDGEIYLVLYSNEAYFPKQPEKAVLKIKQVFSSKMMLQSLPYGTYALAFFIDKNKNGVLDTNFLGIPTEYFGFSNNKLGLMGPPSFKQAQFQHQSEQTTLLLELK